MDYENYFRFIFAFLFVLGLIGVLTALVRRYGLGMVSTNMRKGQDRRLSLVEVLPIDAKRRAILLRRDDVEHLVIIGAESETVVETCIEADPSFSKVLKDTPSLSTDTTTDQKQGDA